ncbi:MULTISPECIES: YoaK family protein [unclassified Rhizobium]|uniref:YoaK family protein n=1 Tax=unclassified Rhizobium TaxID=2613769 RepID=UPI001ADC0189|nr:MULTISPECIES: YoaK family protein [unclassified Rhizobium]MBO9096592.1 DUF1275 domain-containing protein [Rhizobium sp. L58/93]MBO9136328.1 DUF1275 domain-containing protein [Rhizobium sp. B209b/85]MBO9166848.1 DUF1275 domain-containing protein [Rhizobium sp. L245/93]MBO9182820.1 DUF1275 domain-containing protein [Rhizobium sp. E27B/91]QXZ82718.1 DUF1275 domain-containing protein [Rhizobium sp. K1/93]
MTLYRRRLIKIRRKTTGLALVGLISFIAGMTDAVGLVLSGDFVSFMTGNTTRAAIALGNGQTRHGLVLLAAILIFVGGNALGVVLAHAASRPAFVVLGWVSVLLSLASTFASPSNVVTQFYLVVLAMGMINATVEHVEGLPIGLTYVTGALSRFGRGIGRLMVGDRDFAWTIQIVPWIGMLAGAVVGALLVHQFAAKALLFVAVMALIAAFVTLIIPPALQHRYRQRVARQALATGRAP